MNADKTALLSFDHEGSQPKILEQPPHVNAALA